VHLKRKFHPTWMLFFFFELIGSRAFSSMSTDFLFLLWFLRYTHPKEDNKSRIPKFGLSYFIPNFNAFFFLLQNHHLYGYCWTINKLCHNISKISLKLEIVKQDKCTKYNVSSISQCQTH